MTHSTLRKNSASRRARKLMEKEVEYGPKTASIEMILGYSKALQVVNAPPVGQIAVILN
jgi:hypothetical protein